MNPKIPFRINYPLDILDTSKKIDFNDENNLRKLFSRNIFYYRHKSLKINVLKNRYKILLKLAKEVLKLIHQNIPSREVLSISAFGSALFSRTPSDFDFLVIVKGNVFLLEEKKIYLKNKGHTLKYSVGVSIKGLDNLSYGIFDLKSKISALQQSQVINRTAILLFRRHLPIIGYDFFENKDVFLNNIYAQISDLLTNTYNLYYLKNNRHHLKDFERAKKILSRLCEAVSYLVFDCKDLEVKRLRKKIFSYYHKKNISFLKSKRIFEEFKTLYDNKAKKLESRILREMLFKIDDAQMQQIFRKTRYLLIKKKIGKFLPVIAKIVDSSGEVISSSKRIKKSIKSVTPIHAEICAIRSAKARKKTNWKDYTLYCSLEPCAACAKAISEAGIKKVVYCLADPLLSYYGRKRDYYYKKNISFYRHNSADLTEKFQRIYFRLYNKNKQLNSQRRFQILDVLLDKRLMENITNRLERYWKCIGLPHKWIRPILDTLLNNYSNEDLAVEMVRKKFPSISDQNSLDYSEKLFMWRQTKIKNLARRINKHLVGPVIGDVGGRVDDLVKEFSAINSSVKKAYITDIDYFSEESMNHKINFIVQPSKTKLPFVKGSINTIILSMVLHHLKNLDQINLIKSAGSSLNKGGRVILIEDTYPNHPKIKGLNKNIADFLRFNSDEKKKILSFYDWFGNRLMRNRDSMFLPYNYKTMEGWKSLFERYGLVQIDSKFIKENLSHPDLFPPKAIMVFQKMR
ncbi:hypothetical protein HY212_04075 [Candidatus Pacearchaeota archaeon]|nr:hypothetical protein [Candidatus Pacearchaeota archaeon]